PVVRGPLQQRVLRGRPRRHAGAHDRRPGRGAGRRARPGTAQGAADLRSPRLLRRLPGAGAGRHLATGHGRARDMTPWALLAQAAHAPSAHETAEKAAEGAAEHHLGIAEILTHHVVDHRYHDLYLFGVNVGPSKHLLWFAI